MEVRGIELVKPPEIIQKEEEKKRMTRERQQQKALHDVQLQQHIDQLLSDRDLVRREGRWLMDQVHIVQPPSAARIREYQRTKEPSAFDGLKRVGLEGRK